MNSIFTPCSIGSKKALNRFAVQAMESNDAGPGGTVSSRAIERYKTLARGGWGIIVVEALSVTQQSMARRHGMIIKEKNLDGFKRLVQAVKTINPDCVLLFQITHAGRNSNPGFGEKVRICPQGPEDSRYLSADEIQRIADLFVTAACLARKAGADGVDLKMCHGYFGAEMLRPENTREDEWGGPFENRTRFLKECVKAIQSECSANDFVLGSRISLYEGIRGGCGTAGPDELVEDLTEMLDVIRLLHTLGMQVVNVSAGIPGVTSELTRPVKGSRHLTLAHLRYTKTVKDTLNAIQSGMRVIASAFSVLQREGVERADEMLRKEYTDFTGWGRQSFADPLLPEKLLNNREVNWCTACSRCSKLMLAQYHDGCALYDPYYKELYRQMRKRQ